MSAARHHICKLISIDNLYESRGTYLVFLPRHLLPWNIFQSTSQVQEMTV